mmetsp:Transcript_5727/g.17051  ORF Transcript_5727/g.17051 Transcript_5727/m.17051 type:complete len:117 (-) Transcript_5727:1232-1582(-)
MSRFKAYVHAAASSQKADISYLHKIRLLVIERLRSNLDFLGDAPKYLLQKVFRQLTKFLQRHHLTKVLRDEVNTAGLNGREVYTQAQNIEHCCDRERVDHNFFAVRDERRDTILVC